MPTSRAGRIAASAYVVVVGALATTGAATGSTGTILLAGLITLPTSVPAVIGYYVAYGLLAQVPGANPDSASGYEACSPGGGCDGSSTGDLATWFAITTDVVGISALVFAALVNVIVVGSIANRRAVAPARTRPQNRP